MLRYYKLTKVIKIYIKLSRGSKKCIKKESNLTVRMMLLNKLVKTILDILIKKYKIKGFNKL